MKRPRLKNPKTRGLKFNENQILAANTLMKAAKNTKIVSEEQFMEDRVGYVGKCIYCGHINAYTLLTEVLFHTKELCCEECKAMYPIEPIPVKINVEEFAKEIEKTIEYLEGDKEG